MRYAHAQISWLNIIILGTVALLCLTAASTIPGAPGFIPIGVGSQMLVLGREVGHVILLFHLP